MTADLDTLLRDADPLRDETADATHLDATHLDALRARVDAERGGTGAGQRSPRWGRRIALVAAAAATLTAVPLVISALQDDGAPEESLSAAVADTGEIYCGSGYTTAVPPAESPVRLLPDRLPAGWSYTEIFVRQDDAAGCVPPSLTALRLAADGTVTGRISVTGPVEARVDEGRIVAESVPDELFGHPVRRFDVQSPEGVPFHRWFWTDERGRQWSVEGSGLRLDEARQDLAAVSVTGSDLGWDPTAAPGWTLVHRREGASYGVTGRVWWSAQMTDGAARRFLDVSDDRGVDVPLLASTGVGEQVTTVAGHPAVLGQVREAPSGIAETDVPPGTNTRPVLVEIAPGTVAISFATEDDLADVERMLGSLRQVDPTDPRIERYGEG